MKTQTGVDNRLIALAIAAFIVGIATLALFQQVAPEWMDDLWYLIQASLGY